MNDTHDDLKKVYQSLRSIQMPPESSALIREKIMKSARTNKSKNRSIRYGVFAAAIVATFLTAGALSRFMPTTHLTSPYPHSTHTASSSSIRHIDDTSQVKPGTLDPAKASLGGIYIGDSQSHVGELYGAPTQITQAHGTPFLMWYYKNLNMYVLFYRNSENAPAGVVVEIQVNAPSKVKTETGIKIGSSLKDISRTYPTVYVTGDGWNAWVVGARKTPFGMYYPSYQFLLYQGKVTGITLSNEEMKPTTQPDAQTTLSQNDAISSAVANQRYANFPNHVGTVNGSIHWANPGFSKTIPAALETKVKKDATGYLVTFTETWNYDDFHSSLNGNTPNRKFLSHYWQYQVTPPQTQFQHSPSVTRIDDGGDFPPQYTN